jgi:hypothetical protein
MPMALYDSVLVARSLVLGGDGQICMLDTETCEVINVEESYR